MHTYTYIMQEDPSGNGSLIVKDKESVSSCSALAMQARSRKGAWIDNACSFTPIIFFKAERTIIHIYRYIIYTCNIYMYKACMHTYTNPASQRYIYKARHLERIAFVLSWAGLHALPNWPYWAFHESQKPSSSQSLNIPQSIIRVSGLVIHIKPMNERPSS